MVVTFANFFLYSIVMIVEWPKFQPVAFPFNNPHSGLGFHVIKSLPFLQTKNKSTNT